MTPTTPGAGAPSRRRVLAGMGAALAAPAALALPLPASAAADPDAPECLAGLVQEGDLSYGDLMAG